MTQIFSEEERKVIPVTLIQAGPCKVLQVKTKEKDGSHALQIGFEEITNAKKQKKSAKGKQFSFIREFPITDTEGEIYQVGDVIDASKFQEGERVQIVAVSKGKGFQGGVKRWGFSGRNATHGVKHEHRTIGSTGQRFPQHVVKGRPMPGHMGVAQVTVRNLKIIKVDPDHQVLAIKGSVPGSKGTLLAIQKK